MFSIILCTVNRLKTVNNFLNSLAQQTCQEYELIIVDQNNHNKISELVKQYNFSFIKILKTDRGLSKARNLGISYSSGELLAFPDDDCQYPPDLLHNVKQLFDTLPANILMGKTIDISTGKIVAGKKDYHNFTMKPLCFAGSSTTLFINLLGKNKESINFDEDFGMGSTFYAEEENDLLMRLLHNGWTGFYRPDKIVVYHPPSDEDIRNLYRAQKRGLALGALVAKHIFMRYGFVLFMRYLAYRSLGGIIVSLLHFDVKKMRFQMTKWCGIWKGFMLYSKKRIF